MKNKYSYLSKNILLFSISSFGQKILAFLLVPLYTSVLSTADYGTVDLITTTVSILVPVFTINISEGVLRFTLKDKDNKDYFSYGIYMTIKAALILLVLLFLLSIIPVEYSFKKYYAWMYLIFIANCIYGLFQNYLRAVDKVPIMVFSSLLNTVVMLVSNIILLVYIKIGITGYFVSMFLGIMAANIYMLFKGKLVRCITLDFKNNPKMKKECISYCFPTIFTALAWWINSSLDKYFVTGMLGVSENVIYSVSYKIPTILGVFQNIFSQAWMLSAINEYDADDSDGFFGKTYEMNLETMNHLELFQHLGFPVLLGTSRKSMIGLTLDLPVDQRVEGTIATSVIGVMKGCAFVRVHDVKENRRAVLMTEAILGRNIK